MMPKSMIMIRKKILKYFAKILPGNALRVRLLRMCNYMIGKDVYVGEDLIIIDDLSDPATCLIIEDRTAISPRVTFVLHSAPNESRIRKLFEKKGRIVVRQDAWIGTGAVILPDIEIGEGAIVGSNSVVTRNVPNYTVVAGAPARVIKTFNAP
jgi:acetyltransferase-like isoleucine patch superfamily enzyme